ncbi:hypothetical protein A6R68_03589, partial [Neotoma lepida]
MTSMSAHPFRDLPLGWEQHCKLLPGVADIQASQVARWTVDEAQQERSTIIQEDGRSSPLQKRGVRSAREEAGESRSRGDQIDGKAFLLLTQADIVKVMKIKLGPALKIYNSILMFRNSQ